MTAAELKKKKQKTAASASAGNGGKPEVLGNEAADPSVVAPPPWKPQQQPAITPERVIPAPKVPVLKARRNEGRKKTYLALVELFAGLRTTHLAARQLEDACIVMAHAAEKCEFANRLAAKNKVAEVLHTDVRSLGETWAKSFVEDARKGSAR